MRVLKVDWHPDFLTVCIFGKIIEIPWRCLWDGREKEGWLSRELRIFTFVTARKVAVALDIPVFWTPWGFLIKTQLRGLDGKSPSFVYRDFDRLWEERYHVG